MKLIAGILLLTSFLSCTKLIENIDSDYNEKINSNGVDHFNLIFSNNISGETHPCGCRHFPLGGLPQVAGIMFSEAKDAPTIYVDTGDTFFPTPEVPEHMKKSLPFTASKIAFAMEKLNLRYFVPGEADFALGINFLNDLSKKYKFKILIANLKNDSKINAKAWDTIEFANHVYAFIGVVSPSLYSQEISANFTSSTDAISKSIQEIEKKFSGKKIKFILLSHSGIDDDKKIASKFKKLNWIIGSHTQSFLRDSLDINKTRIVQVLSRNHYLGKIEFSTDFNKAEKYSLVEVKDETEKLMPNNPLINWLQEYKTELSKIQEEEQKYLFNQEINPNEKIATAKSCMQCHDAQTKFWQKTAHSLAFDTLAKNKAEFNRECIGCHSVKFNDQKGFLHPKNVVLFENIPEAKLEAHREAYFEELKGAMQGLKSVRDAKPSVRLEHSKKWQKLDEKFQVSHNFSNVQCLNCHNQSNEHPFEFEKPQKITDFAPKCMTCHTRDQSPTWYEKDDKGIATELNREYFQTKLKEVSCPKFEM